MIVTDDERHSCEKCGKSFEPRSGSGGSVQRFCCTRCRLSFHKERLRRQRIGSYAGQFPEPATSDPATLFEQAERLPLDQRGHLIERLLAKMPPDEKWLAGRNRTRVAKALDERKRRAS